MIWKKYGRILEKRGREKRYGNLGIRKIGDM
jgi:hypothetical protein